VVDGVIILLYDFVWHLDFFGVFVFQFCGSSYHRRSLFRRYALLVFSIKFMKASAPKNTGAKEKQHEINTAKSE
jgi:hypothetical protein